MEVKYIQHCGDDLAVVNAARVSFDKTSRLEWDEELNVYGEYETTLAHLSEADTKLINYLAKHEHFSPFNHTFITLHVKAPLFVARQLVKHEYMPWNEVSRRYVDKDPEFYRPVWRMKAENVKQGSGDEFGEIEQLVINETDHERKCLHRYKELLAHNVAPEQARMVLPQNMYTEWYWSGTLKAWAKMYNLRIDAHTQVETQLVAKEAGSIIYPLFPVSWEALTNA